MWWMLLYDILLAIRSLIWSLVFLSSLNRDWSRSTLQSMEQDAIVLGVGRSESQSSVAHSGPCGCDEKTPEWPGWEQNEKKMPESWDGWMLAWRLLVSQSGLVGYAKNPGHLTLCVYHTIVRWKTTGYSETTLSTIGTLLVPRQLLNTTLSSNWYGSKILERCRRWIRH